MEKLIDPLYDTGCNLIFGSEKISNDLLKEFLNSLFEGDSELSGIESIEYLNNEHPG